MSIAGILAMLAIPSMRDFSRNARLTSASNDLLASMQLARTEAIKRQVNVAVCAVADPSANAPECSYGAFRGWIVFVDADNSGQRNAAATEPVLERHAVLDSSVIVHNDGDGYQSFNRAGFAQPPGALVPTRNVVFCDARGIDDVGGDAKGGRALTVTPTGRGRVTRAAGEVSAALGLIGGSCP